MSRVKLLLVEDEKRMSQALCELLRLEQYDADAYDNGIGGLAAIQTGVYDIAVLDVMLPGKNGFEVVRQARKDGV